MEYRIKTIHVLAFRRVGIKESLIKQLKLLYNHTTSVLIDLSGCRSKR